MDKKCMSLCRVEWAGEGESGPGQDTQKWKIDIGKSLWCTYTKRYLGPI